MEPARPAQSQKLRRHFAGRSGLADGFTPTNRGRPHLRRTSASLRFAQRPGAAAGHLQRAASRLVPRHGSRNGHCVHGPGWHDLLMDRRFERFCRSARRASLLSGLCASAGQEKLCRAPVAGGGHDDLMFASVNLSAEDSQAGQLQPLLIETYRGDQGGEIDALVEGWRRNLKFAFPEIDERSEHDILLASREAILNALKHGCRQQADKTVELQIIYHAARNLVRIYVDDPGDGHAFDFNAQDENAEQDLIDEHHGLIFIMHLAHSLKFERRGASLTLDFLL